MSGTSRLVVAFCLATLPRLSIGCVRISKTTEIEELKARVGKLEQRAEALEVHGPAAG